MNNAMNKTNGTRLVAVPKTKIAEQSSDFFIANDKKLPSRVLSLGGGNNITMLFGIGNSIDIVGNGGYTYLLNSRPSIQ